MLEEDPNELEFAKWTYEVKESEIRRLLKYQVKYYFGGGLPGALPLTVHSTILRDMGLRFLEQIDQGKNNEVLMTYNYGTTPGDDDLRKILMKRLIERQHLPFEVADYTKMQITQGAQQAIFCVMDALINPGDVVLVPSPTYLGFVNVAKKFGAIIVGVPTDQGGLIVEQVQKAIQVSKTQFHKKPKFIYVIATSDNPKGTTMSVKRRKELFDLAVAEDIYLFEDDAYKEIQFGKSYLPIKSFDIDNDRVLYTASTSKEAGVFRLGYSIFPESIQVEVEKSKGNIDLCTPTLIQKLVAEYYKGPVQDYLTESVAIYEKRKEMMIKEIDETFPGGTRNDPTGGFFIWWEADSRDFDAGWFNEKIAIPNDVLYVPGKPFYPPYELTSAGTIQRSEEPTNGMRLSYSKVTEKTIEEGIPRLGKLLADHIA